MVVDYYLALTSPFTYMGHARFMALAERAWRSAEQDSEIDAFLSVSTEEFVAALSSHLRL